MTPLRKPPYEPSPWGARFHALTVNEALGGGAAGGGKSVCLRMDPLRQIIVEHQRCMAGDGTGPAHPHPLDWGHSKGRALYLRRTTPMLKQTEDELQKVLRLIDPDVGWNENDKVFTFASGYQYKLGHCKDRGSWSQYWGDEWTWVGYDEVTQFLQKQYETINSRVRTDDPVLMQMLAIRAMGNPVFDLESMEGLALDENPNWVRDYFVKPWPDGERVLVREVKMEDGTTERWTRCYLPARLRDNPNKEFAREYELTLRLRKAHIRRALLEGDWFVTEGAFFSDEWDPSCVVTPFEIPHTWPIFRSMDWGFKAPGCVHWWTMDPDDNLICLREFTFKGMDAAKVAAKILEIEKGEGWVPDSAKRSPFFGPADTQLWEKRGDTGLSKAEEMAAMGVFWGQADKKSRARNAERMSIRMKDRAGGIPGLTFFRGACPKAVETIPQVQVDPTDKNAPMDGGDDHWLDSCLYACAYASHGRRGLPKRQGMKDDDEDDEAFFREEAAKRKKVGRGRLGYG